MADKTVSLEQAAITLEPAEPVYILPPHPEAHVVSDSETVMPDEPTVADETLGQTQIRCGLDFAVVHQASVNPQTIKAPPFESNLGRRGSFF
jgi:hypothetical protein